MWESDVLLFSQLANIVSILFYDFIELIILLYTVLLILRSWYKEYIICLILFSTFSDVSPGFTWTTTIANLWSICFGVKILSPSPWINLYLASETIEDWSQLCRDSWSNLIISNTLFYSFYLNTPFDISFTFDLNIFFSFLTSSSFSSTDFVFLKVLYHYWNHQISF